MTQGQACDGSSGHGRVVVEDGKVVDVSEPRVEFCPLFSKHRGIEKLTKENVRQNVEFRIKDFGMFTERREMRMKDFLSFGVSELMSMCVSKGMLDCAVIVCDGAGTAIVDDPELIQGIGGRISGWWRPRPSRASSGSHRQGAGAGPGDGAGSTRWPGRARPGTWAIGRSG